MGMNPGGIGPHCIALGTRDRNATGNTLVSNSCLNDLYLCECTVCVYICFMPVKDYEIVRLHVCFICCLQVDVNSFLKLKILTPYLNAFHFVICCVSLNDVLMFVVRGI